MNRIAIAALFALFVCGVVSAQTCTPIRLAETNKYNDLGGPFYDFWINGTQHEKHDTVTLSPTNWFTTYTVFHGYVNVYGGLNGCLAKYWDLVQFQYYYGLYDLTIGKWVNDSSTYPINNGKICGPYLDYCSFSTTGGTDTMGVTPGHNYHLWAFAEQSTTVGTTVWYSDYVTINVQ